MARWQEHPRSRTCAAAMTLGRHRTAPYCRDEALNCFLTPSDPEGSRMKLLRWALVAVAVALGLALLAGKSDLRRYQRMRRM
jgi:hypothetical protein